MNLIKNFKAQVADYNLQLSDIQVEPQEVTLLHGPSGSGKTSFLMGLLGLLQSTYVLQLSNAPHVKNFAQVPASQKAFGVVFQFDNLFEHLSVYKNLHLVKPKTQSKEDFKLQLANTKVSNLLEKKARVLSGGEQQMVACQRLFLQRNKRIILLDEPWSSMDPENKNYFRSQILEHIKDHNLACITVSHDEQEIKHLSPKFVYDFNQVARFEKGHPLA